MPRKRLLTLAVLSAAASLSQAATPERVEELVVTGVRGDTPLHLHTDPRNPRQPLPAHDGADYLKTIPGFSVIRKGGSDGDPVLRGMAGSRIAMLADGGLILGGCDARMDPPTAYIFPETFDSITIIKGPQSVRHGPGNSAGVVLFERDNEQAQESGLEMHSSVLGANFGRRDGVVDLRYRSPIGEVRGSASSARADDFADGDGTVVHSRYERWNAEMALAWTPDAQTRLEFSTGRSDGEAAYADRAVDGSSFSRESYNVSFRRRDLTSWLSEVELQAYHNEVDHVMDNFSLRQPSGMMGAAMAMNPQRSTFGGKAGLTFLLNADLELHAGLDMQNNRHSSRSANVGAGQTLDQLARADDGRFEQVGAFAELSWGLGDDRRLIAGLRLDHWTYSDQRQSIALNMMNRTPNPSAGSERRDSLHSGFLRLEDRLGDSGLTWYAGIGHNERFPDYWEMTKESADSLSSVHSLEAERNSQIDTGLLFKGEHVEASLSLFYSRVEDYILIQNSFPKPALAMSGMAGMNGMAPADERLSTIARNVDARSWGLELDGQIHLTEHWRMELALASVRGANDTDGRPLAQLPPLEGRVGLHYVTPQWSGGLLWRSLQAQKRVDIGKGNIAGQDFGPTGSASILSFNAAWRPGERLQITAGIDNLLDATYAEHISRAGASIPGFEQTSRINEPGRTLWTKASYTF